VGVGRGNSTQKCWFLELEVDRESFTWEVECCDDLQNVGANDCRGSLSKISVLSGQHMDRGRMFNHCPVASGKGWICLMFDTRRKSQLKLSW
jgi:hypothetical protein